MGGLFSVRLAPGVRLSASSRGLRAHVGPRGARVHVGGGRTGVSTGAGPFTYYQSASPSRGRPRSGTYYSGPSPQHIARATKAEQAALIDVALRGIANIHRETFPPLSKPPPPSPDLTPYPDLLTAYEKQELRGIKWSDLSARKKAKARARELADQYALHLLDEAAKEQAAAAERIDKTWMLINTNHPEALMEILRAAFEDNEAPVAAVGVQRNEVQLVVLVPSDAVIPDRQPSTTAAGNLSLAKMTKTMSASWYRELVAGHVVASAKEAFAVGPGLSAATVLAVRDNGPGAKGERTAEPVLATRLERRSLDRVNWSGTNAWDVATKACEGEARYNLAARTGALTKLDLSDEPELAELVHSMDFN